MKYARSILITVAVLICGFSSLSSADDTTVSYLNAKALGMGNSRIAGGFDYNGFVDNPALLARAGRLRFSILRLPLAVNQNLLDVGDFLESNQENFENFTKSPGEDGYMTTDERQAFLKKVEKEDGKWGRVIVSPMFDIAFSAMEHHFGLAVLSVSDVGFKVDRGIYEPRVWGEGQGRFAAVLGYARPLTMLYPGLTVGANLKYLQRRTANLFQISATELGNAGDTLDPVLDELKNKETSTVAADVGMLLDLPLINSEVGAAFNSLGDGRGASFDLGIARRMYNDRVTVLADYIDFFDNNKENVFNKLHFGAEYKYRFIAVRGGINRGYPVAGIGLNTKIIDVDFAYFTRELSNAPGVDDDQNFVLQLKIGW